MKIVMISCNEAIDDEVSRVLTECGLENYTKFPGVFGRGRTSGTHLGTDVWPGRNNIYLVAAEEEKIQRLLGYIRELRKKLGEEGVKGFVWALEEVT